MHNEPKTEYIRPNLAHFTIKGNKTERDPRVVPLNNIDVHHLYYTRLTLSYDIPKSLNPSHAQTTLGSTKWASLFFKDLPQPKIQEARLDIMAQTANAKVGIHIRDATYKVVHDGYLIGPERCTKHHWKGTCDACFLRQNEHKRETLEHIFTKCPFYTSIIRAVLFNVVHAYHDNNDIRKILNSDEEKITELYAREIVSGSTKFSNLTCIKNLKTIWPNIAGTTVFTIMKARNQNADPTYPLKMNAEDIYNEIRETILSIAKADRKKAEIKVKTLEIRYQYTPKEDSCPIAKWKKNWGKIVKYINGEMELTFKDFKDTPFLSHPTEPDTNDINRRNSYRILQMNLNTRH